MLRTHVNRAKWSDLLTMANRVSHYERVNKHCSQRHSWNYEQMCKWLKKKNDVSQMKKESDGLSTGGGTEQQRNRSIRTLLDLSPLSFSFHLHPLPFILTRFVVLLRYNLPPSSLSFCLSFSASVILFKRTSGGIGVAGPHPSQTTAWMVPCSVQFSALQSIHNEH